MRFWRKKSMPKHKPKPNKIPFYKLFRYASCFDLCLIIFGCLCAAAAGAARATDVFYFGFLINTFVHFKKSKGTEEEKFDISKEDLEEALNFFGKGLGGIATAELVFGYLMMVCLNTAADRQLLHIRCLFFKSVLRQEMAWFDIHHSTDFANTSVENLNNLRNGIGEKLGLCCYFSSVFVAGSVISLVHGWKLSIVVLSVTPILVVTVLVLTQMQTIFSNEELNAYAGAGGVAEEILSSIRTVAAFGGESKAEKKYETKLAAATKAGKKLRILSSTGNGLAWFFLYATYAVSFWYGVQLIIESENNKTYEYEAGTVIIVFFGAIMASLHFTRLGPYLEAISASKGAAPIIYNTIERVPQIDSLSPLGMRPTETIGKIQFHNIYFAYPSRPDINILNGVSITVYPGQTVAFVGSSGCGKSTLLQLLLRFYTPTTGEVVLDNNNTQTLNIAWLRDQIGVVGQEPSLFAMTIKENIQLGSRDTLTDEEIIAAAKAANCHDFIMKLPNKYDTVLGERGAKLSGGQKQRIAIARALAKNPKILLLDEATSALDLQSEAVVQEALEQASIDRTTIIVAHRLSTIQNADKIFVLHLGRVVEAGTHVQLLLNNGLYVRMLKTQLERDEEDEEEFLDELQKCGLSPILSSEALPEEYTMPLQEVEKKFKAPFRRVLRLSSKEWHLLLLGCLGSFGFGCAIPSYAVLLGEIMRILGITDHELALSEAKIYSGYFAIVGVGAGVSVFMQIYFFSLAGEKLTMRLRQLLFRSLLQQEISWFDQERNSVGALCARLASDAYNIQGVTGTRLGALLQTLATLILAVTLAIFFMWKQALVTICLMPFIFLGVFLESKWTEKLSLAERESVQLSGKIAIETINNIKTVASLSREETFQQMYVKSLASSEKKLSIPIHIHGLLFGSINATLTISYIICIHYGAHLVSMKEAVYHDIFRVAELILFGTIMVASALANAPGFEKGLISAGKIFELLDRETAVDIENKQKLPEPNLPKADVEFQNVKFVYPSRPTVPILTDFSCKISAGKTLALVGSSGCGKSTCVQILERFYDPYKGLVKLGGNDITAVSLSWLRSQLGLVSQEPILFDGSVSENIAYGDNTREIGMEEIISAAKKANIHNFVVALPNGYDTNVGKKGTQLSGGQKQRIAIARALIRNPKVLLLDEATSALDIESERVVQEALDEAMVGRTSIVIAHRLSTIQNAHLIVFMHEGKIIEQGTHFELMALKGCYYQLRRAPSRISLQRASSLMQRKSIIIN